MATSITHVLLARAAVLAGSMLLARPGEGQAPVPQPHPTPLQTPTPEAAPDSGTFPGVSAFADVAKTVSKTISAVNAVATLTGAAALPVRVATTPLSTLGAYYSIVGEREKELSKQFEAASDLINRDLRAAGVNTTVQQCTANPAACGDVSRYLTAETKSQLDRSRRAYEGFVSGFDPNQWTDGEKKSFLTEVGPKAVLGLADGVLKGEVYWDVVRKARAADTLGEFFGPGSAPKTDEVTLSAQDYDAAQSALRAQGAAAADVNRLAPAKTTESTYASEFAKTSGQEDGRLDAAARDSQAKFDAFARQLSQSDRDILANLRATQPQVDVLTPLSVVVKPEEAAKSGDGKDAGPVDHCPNGAFVCPNGNPWPKCTHPEKYSCPPAEFAAQAAQETAAKKASPKK